LPPGGEDDNANDCNMSQLLELCSGKFQGKITRVIFADHIINHFVSKAE